MCIRRTPEPVAEEEEEGGFQTGWAQICLDGAWARFSDSPTAVSLLSLFCLQLLM